VAEWVIDELGEIPENTGDSFVADRWEVTVLSLDGRAIGQVRLRATDGGELKDGLGGRGWGEPEGGESAQGSVSG